MAVQHLTDKTNDSTNNRKNGYSTRPITETLTNGFFSVDNKWTVKYWNKAAEELLGVPANEIVGRNLWEKFVGVLPLEFYAVHHKAFLTDIPVHFEEYWVEMGSWFDVITYYCDDTLSVSFKSKNKPYSEYPENPGKRLKVLTELYKFVTEITNDCLWEWNLVSGEIFWIDGGHKRVLGYPIENALIPQSFWESRIHPDDKDRVLAGLHKTITEASVSTWEYEYRFKKADGDYAHVHDRAHIIHEEGIAARMIGATEDITKRVLLEKKLAQEISIKQRELTAAVLTGQENERAEIGKELHDNLNQILAVAKLYIQMAGTPGQNREEYLKKSAGFIVKVIEEIRRIAKTLVIPGMHGITLSDSIKGVVNDLGMVDPLKVTFSNKGIDENELNETLQLAIFRIVQEQLTNILKYSGATDAAIALSREEDQLVLLISDNGVGCDLAKEKKGVGIINIISRAELCHGSVSILSKPGEGYKLKVIFPLKTQINTTTLLKSEHFPLDGNV